MAKYTKPVFYLLLAMLAMLAMLAPIFISFLIAKDRARDIIESEFSHYSSSFIKHANNVMLQAKNAIDELSSYKGPPCTTEHLEKMKEATFVLYYIKNIDYIRDSKVLCSSLGGNKSHSGQNIMRITHDGYSIQMLLGQIENESLITVGRGNYVVTIHSSAFFDGAYARPKDLEFAIYDSNGRGLPLENKRLWVESKKIYHYKSKNNIHVQDYDAIYISMEYPILGVKFVEKIPLTLLREYEYKEYILFLPLGAIISTLIFFLVVLIYKKKVSIRKKFLRAIRNRDFVVHYQPIMHLDTGKMAGAEALVRWQRNNEDCFTPDIFIPMMEREGVITGLTHLVIDMVFEQLGAWLHHHPEKFISINLSVYDLATASISEKVTHLLEKWMVNPCQISFELTEHSFINPEMIADEINRLRNHGHPIYIDDFGTGYSSFHLIKELDIDQIKIDKSFMHSYENKEITHYMIDMAHSLRFKIVAEGIENEKQRNWLIQHGVQYGQGWFYSSALDRKGFLQWFISNQRIDS